MIVFALRHADRKPDPADELKPEGVARAKLLGRMLAESGVSVAFCSKALRAQRTLDPLKAKLGTQLAIELVGIDGSNQPDRHVKAIVAAIRMLSADEVVVVVSHSDTTPLILESLTGSPVGPIGGHEFDKLFVASIDPAGSATLLTLRYGAPT